MVSHSKLVQAHECDKNVHFGKKGYKDEHLNMVACFILKIK